MRGVAESRDTDPAGPNSVEPAAHPWAGVGFDRAERTVNYGRCAALLFGALQFVLVDIAPASPEGLTTLAALVPLLVLLLISPRAQRAPRVWQRRHAVAATTAEITSVVLLMSAYSSRELWPLSLLIPLIAAIRFGWWGALSVAMAASVVLAAIVGFDGGPLTALTFQLGMLWIVTVLVGHLARESAQEREELTRAREHEQQLSQELAHQALHDPLTGLANRALFADRLEHALRVSRRSGSSIALLMLDLDRFKVVNDLHGHAVGDRLLVELAGRLRQGVRPGDTVARLGGDEFAVLLPAADEDDAVPIAERLLAAMNDPWRIENIPVTVGASIGIAVADPPPAGNADQLYRDADTAMYAGKRGGRGGYRVFTPALTVEQPD